MIKHHCIVTSEIPQIIKNGGVGTNTLNSALFLRKIAECRCTILFVGDSRGLLPVAKKQLAGLGLELVGLEEVSAPWSTERISPVELADSLRSHWWLQRQDFDVIHFMQYQVPGFAAIRAKRLGTAYQNTPLVLIVNSPVRWLDELAQRTPEPSGRRFLIEYMEKYCVEHADHVQAPTQAMLQFFQSKNWKIRGEKHHLPTFTEKHLPREVPVRKNHFIFFGRLETRKGLGLFVEALDQLAQHRQAPPELKVTFLGKVASVYGQSSESYLHERRRNWPEEGWEVELLTEFDRQQAMEYLDDHAGSIYFIPSLGDNSPNTALECLAQRLRVLAADTPGTGELFADDYSRFSPTAEALLDKMLEALKHGVEKSRPAISEEEVRNKRLAFINRLNQPGDPAANPRLPADGDTLVSAIVPNYNLGPYLEECVKALLTQKHRNLEVIVVDDGSTEQQTQQSLQRLESLQDDHRLRLIRQENGGVCRARNTGAAEAHGQYLVFVDADNLPRPEMIETMLKQLRHAGLDALTCDLYAFDDEQPGGPQNLQFYHAFAGGCLEANLFMNTLGDANMLIRREVFETLGGFTPARNEASADRAFLIRLVRRGFRLDCTNDCVFAYRRRTSSMSRSPEYFWRAQCVRDALLEDLPAWAANAMEAAFPIYRQNGTIQHTQKQNDYREKYLATRKKLEQERVKRRYQQEKSKQRYSTLVSWRSNILVRLARFLKVIPRDY